MATQHLKAVEMEGQGDRGPITQGGRSWSKLWRECPRRTATAIVVVPAVLLCALMSLTATLNQQQQELPTAFHDSSFELHHLNVKALQGRYGRALEDSRNTVGLAQDYSIGAKRRWLDEPFWAGSANGEKTTNVEGGAVQYLTSKVDQPPLSSFPSPEDSTVLFLHVFKCAGTTLRRVFTGWAEEVGGRGSIVIECKDFNQGIQRGFICLDSRNELVATEEQKARVLMQKVLVGHFFWGFQDYTRKPYLMTTTLRNPLELFVSGQQFKHRVETATLDLAIPRVSGVMEKRLRIYGGVQGTELGYLRRLVDFQVTGEPAMKLQKEQLTIWVNNAVENLQTFWLVGVVEQYAGYLEVLRRLLDPDDRYPKLWNKAHKSQENSSPVSSTAVLSGVEPALIEEYNNTILVVQWQVYEVAVQLWEVRCREVLPVEQHARLCDVPPPPSSYRP